MPMVDRKPCPFCGESRTEVHPTVDPRGEIFVVRCLSCAAEGGWGKSEGTAVAHWNLRVPDTGVTAYMTPEHAVTAPSLPPSLSLLGGKPISTYAAGYVPAGNAPGALDGNSPRVEAATDAAWAAHYANGGFAPVDERREICGADDSIPFEYTTIGQKCKNTKPCPVHDDNGNRRRPWGT